MTTTLRSIIGGMFILCFASVSYAEKLSVVITGNTHGVLYPSSGENRRSDGGAARRNAMIKEIVSAEKNCIVVDTGEGFAGGMFDPISQNQQLDMKRSQLLLQTMKIAGYDAYALGEAELNFGPETLSAWQREFSVPILSCNIALAGVRPYIVKETGPFKVGIIGVSPEGMGMKYKLSETPFVEAVAQSIREARKQGATVIVVLSNLNEEKNAKLLKETEGIDVIAGGMPVPGANYYKKENNTYVVKPFPGESRVIRADMQMDKGRVRAVSFNQLTLDPGQKEDANTKKILPACFSDENCSAKEGWIGKCENGGEPSSQCLYREARAIPATLITDFRQKFYKTELLQKWLKKNIPGITFEELDYATPQAKELVRRMHLTSLPAVIFDRSVASEPFFAANSKHFMPVGEPQQRYLLDPAVSGVYLFLDRARKENTVDLFVSLFEPGTREIIEFLAADKNRKRINLRFIIYEKDGQFSAAGGTPEVEEALRITAIEVLYGDKVWEYLRSRAEDMKSSWWTKTARQTGMDPVKIEEFATSAKAKSMLQSNISPCNELGIARGPVILVDNIRIYALQKGSAGQQLLKSVLKE